MTTLNLTANEWGLYLLDREARAAEVAATLNAEVAAAFAAAELEHLRRAGVIREVARIYRPLADKYAADGFADTEGRYAIETAACRYLAAHGREELVETLRDDFLLWEA